MLSNPPFENKYNFAIFSTANSYNVVYKFTTMEWGKVAHKFFTQFLSKSLQ